MNFIVFDLECTCWEGRPSGMTMEIIEIGAVKLNEFGEVEDSFCRFVRPKLHPVLSDFCQRLTSISQIEINRADSFPYVIEDFMDWAEIDDDNYWLCSWGNFDKKQLHADCTLHEINPEWTDFHLNIKQQYHSYKGFRNTIGLKKAVEREGFEFTGIHHRAISDAENLAKVFVKYRDIWQF
jgi:inhibitor of KinA sporulation pathway (predicted exonuclease)